MIDNLEGLLIHHLTREEGFIPHVYRDHLGFWTIGVGRMVDKERGGGITREEAEYLLKHDIQKRTEAIWVLLPWIKSLDHVRQAVLVSMAFQMGVSGLMKFKNTLNYVQQEQWEEAAAGMRASLWARQTPERAERLAMAMETGHVEWLI